MHGWDIWQKCGLAFSLVAAGLALAASAHAGCDGRFITRSINPVLKFYGQDGTTVVATYKGKTADNSLHIAVLDCDDKYFFVMLPDNIPAEVARTDVEIDKTICEAAPASNPRDLVKQGGNGAFDGDVNCKHGPS